MRNSLNWLEHYIDVEEFRNHKTIRRGISIRTLLAPGILLVFMSIFALYVHIFEDTRFLSDLIPTYDLIVKNAWNLVSIYVAICATILIATAITGKGITGSAVSAPKSTPTATKRLAASILFLSDTVRTISLFTMVFCSLIPPFGILIGIGDISSESFAKSVSTLLLAILATFMSLSLAEPGDYGDWQLMEWWWKQYKKNASFLGRFYGVTKTSDLGRKSSSVYVECDTKDIDDPRTVVGCEVCRRRRRERVMQRCTAFTQRSIVHIVKWGNLYGFLVCCIVAILFFLDIFRYDALQEGSRVPVLLMLSLIYLALLLFANRGIVNSFIIGPNRVKIQRGLLSSGLDRLMKSGSYRSVKGSSRNFEAVLFPALVGLILSFIFFIGLGNIWYPGEEFCSHVAECTDPYGRFASGNWFIWCSVGLFFVPLLAPIVMIVAISSPFIKRRSVSSRSIVYRIIFGSVLLDRNRINISHYLETCWSGFSGLISKGGDG